MRTTDSGSVQFAHLIAELHAAGAFTEHIMRSLIASTDRKAQDILELRDQATQLHEAMLTHLDPATWEDIMRSLIGSTDRKAQDMLELRDRTIQLHEHMLAHPDPATWIDDPLPDQAHDPVPHSS